MNTQIGMGSNAMTLSLPQPADNCTGWPWHVDKREMPSLPHPGNPLISIVIPSYNQATYIEETIRSVLLQGYPNIELIIIDGGSTDCTVDILRKYDPWISYWISEPDRGQSHAINKGLEKATGAFIGWQNSDDVYLPNAFHLVVTAAEAKSEVDVFYGNVEVVDANGKYDHTRYGADLDLFAMLPWPIMFNQSMFFRRKVFDEGARIEESRRHHMDQVLFWRLIRAGYKFQYIPELGARYRIHPAAKTNTQFRIACEELFALFEDLFNEPSFPLKLKQKLFQSSCMIINQAYAERDFPLFRELFRSLIKKHGVASINPKMAIKYVLSFTH